MSRTTRAGGRVSAPRERPSCPYRGLAGMARSSYVSVWAIESATSPGSVGWWVICGDGPTDYISGEEVMNPREAVRAFAIRWSEVASHMLRAELHPTIELGSPKTWPELGPLLKNRAELLGSCAADDAVWQPAP